MMRIRLCAVALVLLTLPSGGCDLFKEVKPTTVDVAQPAVMPTYAELATRYNANLAGLDRLWAETKVDVVWYDNGKRKSDDGEGHFIAVLPDRAAIDVGKLGQTMLWIGSNAKQMYVVDAQDDGGAFVVDRANAIKPCAQPLPSPVPPSQVMRLAGITPIDTALASAVRWEQVGQPPNGGGWIGPSHALTITGPQWTKLWIDSRTYMPVRIDAFNPSTRQTVSAWLWGQLKVDVSPAGRTQPIISQKILVNVSGEGGRMQLTLENPTDGRADELIRDRAFDYAAIKKMLKPPKEVVLDAKCK